MQLQQVGNFDECGMREAGWIARAALTSGLSMFLHASGGAVSAISRSVAYCQTIHRPLNTSFFLQSQW